MSYRLIDHTADLGIHVSARTPEALFSEAAGALLDQITDRASLAGAQAAHLAVSGMDWPDLMVNWLRELLYLWNAKEMLMKGVDVHSISENRLEATVNFDPYDPESHVVKSEVKAVTYHQIQVTENPNGWESQIIFDV